MLTFVESWTLPTHLRLSLALEYLAPELKRTEGQKDQHSSMFRYVL